MSQPGELNPKRATKGQRNKSHPRIRTKRSLLFPVRGRIWDYSMNMFATIFLHAVSHNSLFIMAAQKDIHALNFFQRCSTRLVMARQLLISLPCQVLEDHNWELTKNFVFLLTTHKFHWGNILCVKVFV